MIWFGTNLSGELFPNDAALIETTDRGFTVGEGVFETVIVRSGEAFALNRHLARLQKSAEILHLPQPNSELIRSAVITTIAMSQEATGETGRLRITYTAGRGLGHPTILISCTAQDVWPETTSAITVPWVRNERSAIVGAKSTSYAENVIALKEAHRQGSSEAIVANSQGKLCEGVTTNVFVVLDGEVATPPLSSGCLAGVTRELVIEWFGAKERDIDFASMGQVSELFLTSTTRGIHPVTSLDGRNLEVGETSLRLQREFQRLSRANVNP